MMALLHATAIVLQPSSASSPSLQRFPPLPALKNANPPLSLFKSATRTSGFNYLRRSVCPPPGSVLQSVRRRSRCRGAVCYAAPVSPQTLQWISAVSSAVLILAKGTAIRKSFLVPLFALQAPISVISWIKGEYGTWTAFLLLLVRLFYFIPGALELPFLTMLLVIVAPLETMNLRGTQAGMIVSLAIAGYLAFEHFWRAGSLRRAFDQGSIVATLAVICIAAVPCLLLF